MRRTDAGCPPLRRCGAVGRQARQTRLGLLAQSLALGGFEALRVEPVAVVEAEAVLRVEVAEAAVAAEAGESS